MARNRFILLTVLLICALPLWSRVRVLSVCVGTYPANSGWNSLGSVNDNRSIKTVFTDVTSLLDADATFEAFTSELCRLAKSSSKGDTVIVHFSGHGQQILTESSATEVDHVDEAMVPYDAAKHLSASYNGCCHLTDDVFGSYISDIRKALGKSGLVITVIDACHSDSMDKDADTSGDIYQGTDEIFGTEDLSQDSIQSLREYYFSKDDTPVLDSDDMAEAIFIGACASHQRNYEIKKNGEQHGSLTYYFCNAVSEKGLANPKALLTAVHSEMTADNTMKFHGQQPNIRTTLDWEKPVTQKYIPQDLPVTSEDKSCAWKGWISVATGTVILFIIVLILWKRRK